MPADLILRWRTRIVIRLDLMTRTVTEIQKLFLSSSRYAVVGASKDQSKYGTKVRTIMIVPRVSSLLMQTDVAGFAVVSGT